MTTFYVKYPSSSGITSINTDITPAQIIAAGSGIAVVTAAGTTTISSSGAAAAITALTGDVTATGPGSVAATLATVNSNVGSFGTAANVSTVTVNAKGLVTAASNTAIQIAESQVTNLVTDLAAKQSSTLTNTHILVGNVSNVATDVAMSGDATIANTGAVTLATVNSNVGSFGDATHVSAITVTGKGLVTAAASTSIQIAESQVTNLVSDLAAKQSTTLTNAHILVGNGSNVATDVAMSGDITISNAGATAIGALKVTNAMIAASTIDLTAKVTGILPIANGGTGLATNPFPTHVTIWYDEAVASVGNGIGTTQSVSQNFNTYSFQNPPANGDTNSQTFYLAAGTYTIKAFSVTANNQGIVDVYIDNVVIATYDMYSAGTTFNVVKTTSSITVSGNGVHTLKLVTNGKNGSSSNYFVSFTKFWLY